MDIIKDFLLINKQVLKKTIKSLGKNPLIILTGLAYVIMNAVIFGVVLTVFQGFLSIFAGIILAIVSAALISNYLYLLFNIINYDRMTVQDFKDGFTYFLRKVYTVFFFAWIGSMLLNMVNGLMGISQQMISLIVTITVIILLNPLPETLYLKSLDPMGSISYSIDFMKENWVNWLIPNLVLNLLLFQFTGELVTGIFTTHLSMGFGLDAMSLIRYLIGQLIFSFMMIYRGHLYKLLSTSTKRKRMYMNKFQD